jgi:4,5-DOPA dioxygenase extradiol
LITPLLLMYPQADIPVLQLSIQLHPGPRHHLLVGRALAPLLRAGVLIIGSGSLTHDLSEFRGHGPNKPAPDWVNNFANWFHDSLSTGATDDLLDYRKKAPFATTNHPTEEHLYRLRGAWRRGRRATYRTASLKFHLQHAANGRILVQSDERR